MRPGLDRPPASTMRAKVAPESPCSASCPMAASMICVRRSRAPDLVCMNKTLVQLNKSRNPPTIPRMLAELTDPRRFPALAKFLGAGVFEIEDGPDDEFIFGLDRILDGVEVLIQR